MAGCCAGTGAARDADRGGGEMSKSDDRGDSRPRATISRPENARRRPLAVPLVGTLLLLIIFLVAFAVTLLL